MPGAGISGLIDEVNAFLSGLKQELPGLFRVPPPFPKPSVARNGTGRREEARRAITEACERWSRVIGVEYRRVRIKDQKSLWGSCSRAGNLNFNWRLILAPAEVLEYVVIHELCHLKEMNHSRRFWALVQTWCPEQKARRRWLRECGRPSALSASSAVNFSGAHP